MVQLLTQGHTYNMSEKINKIVLQLLNNRGITGDENIREFLSPKPLLTYDPFLLLNMKEGVDLIFDAINQKKKICLYGDYDTDGITSISILKIVLENLVDEVEYYIPSRDGEGYGINKEAIKHLYDKGNRLMITVDCGIVAYDEVEYAKSLGMDVIVTDHHSVGTKTPDCIVINPKQEECSYPFENLAGCGVAFKLAQAIQRHGNLPKNIINDILDIVAIGTIADVVPLVDENRTIVKYGMRKLASSKRPGIEELALRALKNKDIISTENISYNLVPHLNAAGRIDRADIGVELFIGKEKEEISSIVDRLVQLNNRRKELQEKAYLECVEIYENKYKDMLFPIIKLENAHEGITGIVAGKLKDYAGKPIAIVTPKKDDYKGTSRGIDTLNIYEILGNERELFSKFGGHKGACGFTICKENIEKLEDNIQKYMNTLPEEVFHIPVKYDLELTGEDLSVELVKEIEKMEPFGAGNEKPVFRISNARCREVKAIGAELNHGKFKVDLCGYDGLDCVFFNCGREILDSLEKSSNVDFTGRLEINSWRGRDSLQFIVEKII